MEAWRYALASVVGTSHTNSRLPCQDAAACRVIETARCGSVLVCVGSDGAGSALRAEIGSQLACAVLVEEAARLYEGDGPAEGITPDVAAAWLERINVEIRTRAAGEELSPRDFACTLLAAVVEPDRATFLQIGDGAIVVSAPDEPDEYSWVFWPQRGEYANYTRFLTDEDAREHLELEVVGARLDEVALFTDGLQALALQYETRTAYAPFFRSFLSPVRQEPPGESQKLSAALATFLASSRVNSRTDDDKTLVIATRRAVDVPTPGEPEVPEGPASSEPL